MTSNAAVDHDDDLRYLAMNTYDGDDGSDDRRDDLIDQGGEVDGIERVDASMVDLTGDSDEDDANYVEDDSGAVIDLTGDSDGEDMDGIGQSLLGR